MFSKNLSAKLLQLIDEKEMSQETLAEVCNLSARFIGNVIRGKQVPSLDTFEKICAGLEITPDKLLLNESAISPQGQEGLIVNKVFCRDIETFDTYPICPSCNITLERDYQCYCDRCGAKLIWKDYKYAEIVYDMTDTFK